MDKRAILNVLGRAAFAAEVLGEESWNPAGLSAASWTLRSIEGDLAEMHRSGELAERRDVVKQAKEIVAALVEHGHHEGVDKLLEQVPSGLFDVRRIKGLGPKKVRVLWQTLGITSLTELEYACTENRLLELKGFGKKTQENVLKGIAEVRSYLGRYRLDQIEAIAFPVLEALVGAVERAEIVGDLRRAVETVDKIEIAYLGDVQNVQAALRPLLAAPTEEGDVGAPTDDDPGPAPALVDEAGVMRCMVGGAEVRLYRCPHPDAWGATLVVTTGGDAHVEALQARADDRGLSLGRDGLYRGGGDERVPTPDEDAVYAALDLVPTAPERREAHVPLAERGKARPRLLERGDLLGALHNHTTASDGIHTLVQMRQGAIDLGLTYLGVTEHSQTAAYAGGLSADQLAAQQAEAAKLNAEDLGERCVILIGVESDILQDGALDYPDPILARLDVVIASVHTRYGLDKAGATARLVAAASHPATDIVGHPTGRMLLGRPPADLDMAAVLDACAAHGTAIEMNAQPARLDLCDVHLSMAKERGVMVSIAADAHSIEALGYLDYGVRVARRAGLTADDVLNTRSLAELREWLKARRARRAFPAAA